ncbi:hypothetical protein [Micromonospora coriariae]|uniref:hypothetical protein n=1 Tax=Micromonospora coriariae TaxID=285665 RepID=UPI0012FD1E1A|nr:hypothetical protein [Micromonospora coriariae]
MAAYYAWQAYDLYNEISTFYGNAEAGDGHHGVVPDRTIARPFGGTLGSDPYCVAGAARTRSGWPGRFAVKQMAAL